MLLSELEGRIAELRKLSAELAYELKLTEGRSELTRALRASTPRHPGYLNSRNFTEQFKRFTVERDRKVRFSDKYPFANMSRAELAAYDDNQIAVVEQLLDFRIIKPDTLFARWFAVTCELCGLIEARRHLQEAKRRVERMRDLGNEVDMIVHLGITAENAVGDDLRYGCVCLREHYQSMMFYAWLHQNHELYASLMRQLLVSERVLTRVRAAVERDQQIVKSELLPKQAIWLQEHLLYAAKRTPVLATA